MTQCELALKHMLKARDAVFKGKWSSGYAAGDAEMQGVWKQMLKPTQDWCAATIPQMLSRLGPAK